jgi:TRAP-type transport system periplasmic protein
MKRIVFFLLILLLASPALAQQTVRIATVAPDGSGWMKELRAAAAQVKAGTQGRVEVKYFPGGVMGSDTVVLRKMKLGQLQGGVLTSSELSEVYSDAQIYSLPFALSNWEQVSKARASIDPLLAKGFEQRGYKMLGASNVGFAYILSTKTVRSRADMLKVKLWVPQNDQIAIRTFKTGGISPIPLPLGDVFTSLQTGLVDTVANTPSGAVALQWHGKTKHMVDLPLSFVVGFMVMDLRAYQKISPADQKIMDKAFTEAGVRMDAAAKRDNEAALAAMKKQGITVAPLDADETARWRQIGAQATKEMEASKQFSPEILNALRKLGTGAK